MHNWTNFCNIIKFNLKSKSLVAQVATGLFLDEEVCDKLKNIDAYIVSPEIDVLRKLKFKNVRKVDDTKFEFAIEEDFPYDILVGKGLLISDQEAKDVFAKLPVKRTKLIGKVIIDDNLGTIGKVKDVAGTSAQKHLIVDYNGDEVLVPYVQEFIKKEKEKEILMELPTGIIGINKV